MVGAPNLIQLTRAMVIQPEALCREGLCRLLGDMAGVQIAAAASSAAEALPLAREVKPDLILTDLDLPREDGLELVSALVRLPFSPRVVVLTRQSGLAYVAAAMARGARAYLLRSASPVELREALRQVSGGQAYVHGSLAGAALRLKVGGHPDLGERDCALLVHLSRGATNQEVADALFVSEKTVRNALTRLFGRLRVRNRTEAVAAGRELGYL